MANVSFFRGLFAMHVTDFACLRLGVAVGLCCALTTMVGCGQSDQPPATVENDIASPSASEDSLTRSNNRIEGIAVKKYDTKYPEVVLETSLGPITLKLDAEKAPLTVGNFLNYVNRGHYNGTIVHEVHKNFIALLGGYTENLKERTGDFPIRNEAANGLENKRYSVAMARLPDSIDSATTHFFINLADNANLNHAGKAADKFGFCVFGEVISGREIVDQLNSINTRTEQDFPALPTATIAVRNVKRIK